MAKRKVPIHHLHKIKIHHNRWLIWAIAYAVIVTIAVVGYIKLSDYDLDNLVAESDYQSWHSYSNTRLGFSLRYPASWSIEADSTTSVSFTPTQTEDEGLTVKIVSPNAEQSIRNALKIASEKTVKVDGQTGVLLRHELANKHYETIVLVKNNNRLYEISGSGSVVESLMPTFQFVQ